MRALIDEALGRGEFPGLRSPEVLFQIAQEANLVWELGRLLRRKAVDEIRDRLKPDQFLFLNVDPHDFSDPEFAQTMERDVLEPGRVVIEITERTAIKDYPKFREALKRMRQRGYRFAVDDAGSGYAGLGSIANLEPDFIKLDMSLINCIDTNFIKQNLVETMVKFSPKPRGSDLQAIAIVIVLFGVVLSRVILAQRLGVDLAALADFGAAAQRALYLRPVPDLLFAALPVLIAWIRFR